MRVSLATMTAAIVQGYRNKGAKDIVLIHVFISASEKLLSSTSGANEVLGFPQPEPSGLCLHMFRVPEAESRGGQRGLSVVPWLI